MARCRPLPRTFFRRPAAEVAPELLGRYLVRRLDGRRLVLRIVETEAYLGATDRASHAWRGRRTVRNETLYRDGSVAYVYFIYGMYYCLNAVTGGAENGEAVLIRAGEPVRGEARMRQLRGLEKRARPGDIAGGPGKLCMAMAIDRDLDGSSLLSGSLTLCRGEPASDSEVVRGPRIGIAYAGEAASWPLRYAIRGNPHVSRPRPW